MGLVLLSLRICDGMKIMMIISLVILNAYCFLSLARATEVIVESDVPYVYDVGKLESFCRYEWNNEGAE